MAEDDYMSDDVLLGISDTPVGIAKSRAHQRQLNIHSRFEESRTFERPKRQTAAEREKERRDEALAKPISHESKGFALMAKMGFKPGMTLGKKRETTEDGEDPHEHKRLKEPLGIEIKVNRKGLGHEKHEENQRSERVELVMAKMKEQAAKHEELIDDYQKRRKTESSIKRVIKDIYSCRRVCEELDHRKELKQPKVAWYWRSYKVPTGKDDEAQNAGTSYRYSKEDDSSDLYKYSNGLDAGPEIDFNALDETSLDRLLHDINNYLRCDQLYCIWCGSQFSSTTELSDHCPGDTRLAHDGEDHDE